MLYGRAQKELQAALQGQVRLKGFFKSRAESSAQAPLDSVLIRHQPVLPWYNLYHDPFLLHLPLLHLPHKNF